ncbi:MAG: hypothetical protein IJ877_07750 [Candidatus Gastranaerophilales bacterium]|nr:hypothetical protein [Candidatus Gastranaerophilales bacterium]
MTNFNGLSPWASVLNYLNAVKQNDINAKTREITQNTQSNNQSQNIEQSQTGSANSAIIQNLSTNVFSKTPTNFLNPAQVNPAEQAVMQDVLKMNNDVVQKYLQSLLDMPESLDKFLKNANSKEDNVQAYQFLKIFVENMLNNKELSQLLNQNSNNAIQKLLNVITQSLRQGGHDTAQLKEILAVLNTIHALSSLNTNTLRELFLLYIPIDYQVYRQDSDFSKITAENEEGIKNATLSILFETYNFSNILAELSEDNNAILLEIKAGSDFPYDKFKKVVTTVSKESSINVLCDFVKIKDCGSKGNKQNFKVISNDYVPVNILNVSHIVIKAVFKLDSDMKCALEA